MSDPSPPHDATRQLAQLAELHYRAALSDDELAAEKAAILVPSAP